MRVYVYPSDPWACGHYRLTWPAEVLRATGLDVTVVDPSDSRFALGGQVDERGRVHEVFAPNDADVVVLQRPTHRQFSQAVGILRRKSVAVVVDMDDDLGRIHPRNPAFLMMHPNRGDPTHSWHCARDACRDATLVTVSTPALLERYAGHGRGAVLHNYVPRRALEVEHIDSEVLTWCGSLHSHPDDVPVLGASVLNLVRRGATYRTTGSGVDVERALGLPEGSDRSVGTVPFDEWFAAVARSGVALAPLADTQFNEAKSWLKPLEALACGVPVVMSPRREYRRLHELTGVGFLADRPRHWEATLRRLLTSPELRQEQSEAGRAAVREHLVLEDQAWRWAEAWTRAYELERGSVPSGATAH